MRTGTLALAALAFSASLVSGCATQKPHADSQQKSAATPAEDKGFTPINYSHNRLTVAKRSSSLAGAGCNAGGVVHVVDINPCPAHCAGGIQPPIKHVKYLRPEDVPAEHASQDTKGSSETDKSGQTPDLRKDYSYYDLGRWQRYCDGGRLMTYADWDFILKHGGDKGLPKEMVEKCRKPDFTYAEYLEPWKSYCNKPSKVELTSSQKHILKTTQVRPKPVVGNCYNKP